MTKLTERQQEILTRAAERYGVYPHTRAERTVLENIWIKKMVIPSCNGTAKWHATQIGRDALAELSSTDRGSTA